MVLLDVLHEAGVSTGVFGARSVLDVTVRAAAGIGDHYLHRGDRVAFIEYGWRGRRLRASSGHRQYLTLLEWLLDVRAVDNAYDPPAYLFSQIAAADSLLVVLTPLLDTRSAALLARFARSGQFVVAVDTMPPDLLASLSGVVPPGAEPTPVQLWMRRAAFTESAVRLWRIERDNTIAQLREHGVPVVTWAGAGSLDEVLRQVSRGASAPRAVPR